MKPVFIFFLILVHAHLVAQEVRHPVAKPLASSCIDTSLRLLYRDDSFTYITAFITKTRDGGILIPGSGYHNTQRRTKGHIFKCTQQGDTIWTKSYFSTRRLELYKIFELADNSLMVVGRIGVSMSRTSSRYEPILLKLTPSGEVIWHKTYQTKLWRPDSTSGYIDIWDCKEDTDGNMYMCGDIKKGSVQYHPIAFKIDPSGNVLWSNSLMGLNFPHYSGIDISPGKVCFYGLAASPGENAYHIITAALNPVNGDTLYIKMLKPVDEGRYRGIVFYDVTKLNNGNIVVSGKVNCDYNGCSPTGPRLHGAMVEITIEGDLVKSTYVRSNTLQTDARFGRLTVFEDGTAGLVKQRYYSNFTGSLTYAGINNGTIVRERVIPYSNNVTVWVSNLIKTDDGGVAFTALLSDSTNHTSYAEFLKLHSTDVSGTCMAIDTNQTSLEPYTFVNARLRIDSVVYEVLVENQRTSVNAGGDTLRIESNCKQINFCDSLKLISSDTVCANSSVSIIARKNPECGAIPLWSYDTTMVSSFNKPNDSTLTLTFNKAGYIYITASMAGCRLLQDSISCTVLQAPLVFGLGADTSLCPGNTITLNAKEGYAAYQWQDGSADSTFIVTAPGQYYVTVRDACGGSFSDTILVNPHPPIPFEIGQDISICKYDTATIEAPAGFIDYRWTNYNISNHTSRIVSIFPVVDTMYKVVAEKMPGCFASDSFQVLIKNTPAVNLGNDTTLCKEQTLLLVGGSNNYQYLWQDGTSQPNFLVQNPGAYSVTASLNGCTGTDVINVSYKTEPVFSLPIDTTLCKGSQIILNVLLNTEANLLWGNGSASPLYSISKEGSYYVTASNECGFFSDTINIVEIICNIEMPSAFTPNGDGKNELFKVKYPFPVMNFSMEIFNRWGETVYSSNDIYQGWDGRFKNKAALPGAYAWIIQFKNLKGKEHIIKGNVTLIR